MESAKRAGWDMVVWSICLGLALVITHFMKIVVSNVIILGIRPLAIAMDVMSIPLWVVLAITTFYAIWGLWCGYDKKEWDRYVEQCYKDTIVGIRSVCAERDINPPSWLQKETSG